MRNIVKILACTFFTLGLSYGVYDSIVNLHKETRFSRKTVAIIVAFVAGVCTYGNARSFANWMFP